MFAFPFTVTIRTATYGVDVYNNPTPSSWSTSTAAGDIQPVRVDEADDGTSAVDVDEVRFLLESGTVVGSGDELVVDGVTYQVIGPAVARDYSSTLDYVRVRARRTEA